MLSIKLISNKTYWKIMKMLLKSNKGSGNFPPLQNIINDKNLEEFAYDDEEKCDLLNIICKGNAILFGHSFNILWLMTSGPDALFG
jgi:hypothetical protein